MLSVSIIIFYYIITPVRSFNNSESTCAKTILYNFHFSISEIIFVSTISNAIIWQLPAIAMQAKPSVFTHHCKFNRISLDTFSQQHGRHGWRCGRASVFLAQWSSNVGSATITWGENSMLTHNLSRLSLNCWPGPKQLMTDTFMTHANPESSSHFWQPNSNRHWNREAIRCPISSSAACGTTLCHTMAIQ